LKRGDELGEDRPKSESRQKRERQKEREKTAGSKWFDLPAFPRSFAGKKGSITKGNADIYSRGPTAEEMTKELQAIRLRNAMDPKRFFRGGNGAGEKGTPAFAQMGRIISSNLEPASTLSRSERGRTVIDELVKDAQNANYTKRKFVEVSLIGTKDDVHGLLASYQLCFLTISSNKRAPMLVEVATLASEKATTPESVKNDDCLPTPSNPVILPSSRVTCSIMMMPNLCLA
jgi:hypothetical protein